MKDSGTSDSDIFVFCQSVMDFNRADWMELRRIAREVYDSGLHNRDQFKCAVEAVYRWTALTMCAEQIDERLSMKHPTQLH